MQWSGGFQPSVFPARIDDDAVEDFVGLYDVFGGGPRVGGFDGRTLQRRWASAPLGTADEGTSSTHVGVAGGRVLVTDRRAQAHVLDLRTGQEVAVVKLSDRAEQVCARPDGAEFWIGVADGHNVTVSVSTAQVAPTTKPAPCPESFPDQVCAYARAPCRASTADAPGAKGRWTLGTGKGAVTLGNRSPGTAVPMAFAAGGKGWLRPLLDDPALMDSGGTSADLAGGLFVAAYSALSHGYRLMALDAATGERRWDVAIPCGGEGNGPRGITATETRVYVPHWTWLDVFELSTGKHVGTVGRW
jgi:outer membrane protein assembly factor BamB